MVMCVFPSHSFSSVRCGQQLVRCEGEGGLQQHYYHSLKQGLFLEHGSSAVAMGMEQAEQVGLWAALAGGDPSAFVATDRRLRRARPAAVPVRLVVATCGGSGGSGGPLAVAQPFCKLPAVDAADDGGGEEKGCGGGGGGEEATLTVGGLLREHLGLSVGAYSDTPRCDDGMDAVCHGVALPLDAPLAEAWAALAHPDHFLYVAVVPRAAGCRAV